MSGFRIEVAPDCPVESIDTDAHWFYELPDYDFGFVSRQDTKRAKEEGDRPAREATTEKSGFLQEETEIKEMN